MANLFLPFNHYWELKDLPAQQSLRISVLIAKNNLNKEFSHDLEDYYGFSQLVPKTIGSKTFSQSELNSFIIKSSSKADRSKANNPNVTWNPFLVEESLAVTSLCSLQYLRQYFQSADDYSLELKELDTRSLDLPYISKKNELMDLLGRVSLASQLDRAFTQLFPEETYHYFLGGGKISLVHLQSFFYLNHWPKKSLDSFEQKDLHYFGKSDLSLQLRDWLPEIENGSHNPLWGK